VITEKLTVGSLAAVLHETEHKALARVLRVLGEERCVELLAEALLCEHQGGMLTKDGRKRTLGGVFLELCRQQATPAERRAMFR
jgi:PHAX RNA-binding domain